MNNADTLHACAPSRHPKIPMPLFSVVIPTKNRARLVLMALESVMRQSFVDWELTLADNSDDEGTRDVFERCGDARVRYKRSGGLSMPDNWEFAISHSCGQYVCVLEDKQALHFDALARLASLIGRERPAVIRWEWDEIAPYGLGHRIRSFGGDGHITTRSPEVALRALVDGAYFEAKSLLPIPHYSAIRRVLVDRIRKGPVGRSVKQLSHSARSVLNGRILRRPLWRYDNLFDYLVWHAEPARERTS